MAVSLPKLPKGAEFEEFVAALAQSAGFFVERSVIERAVEEVLELDLILTAYEPLKPPTLTLIEAKSGGWGFADVFKVAGWLQYLNLTSGLLAVSEPRDHLEFIQQKSKEIGINLVVTPDLDDCKELLDHFGVTTCDKRDVSIWRFSSWTERQLLKRLKAKKKSHPEKRCFAALDDYFFELHSNTFFTPNLVARARALYEAFQNYSRISARCAAEMEGRDFEDEPETIPKDIYAQTYWQCKYTDIQISTFVEHRARLAILKTAIDWKLCELAGEEERTKESWKILDQEFDASQFLPDSFLAALEQIAEHQYFHRYPAFWQWFLFAFGGFILKDYATKEYEVLSDKTGVPVDEVDNAFAAYEILFPRQNGWFSDLSPNSEIRLVNLFSVPFMGVGANYRRYLYTKKGKFSELELSGQYTLNDLSKWNNLTVDVLSR